MYQERERATHRPLEAKPRAGGHCWETGPTAIGRVPGDLEAGGFTTDQTHLLDVFSPDYQTFGDLDEEIPMEMNPKHLHSHYLLSLEGSRSLDPVYGCPGTEDRTIEGVWELNQVAHR